MQFNKYTVYIGADLLKLRMQLLLTDSCCCLSMPLVLGATKTAGEAQATPFTIGSPNIFALPRSPTHTEFDRAPSDANGLGCGESA